MTRTEQINNEALAAYECSIANDGIDLRDAFTRGACWADEHPASKYNLADIDFVRDILESIIQEAERTTTGNVAHNAVSIRLKARAALNVFTTNN